MEENLSLDFIDFGEAQPILKETFSTWSGGLSHSDYQHYIWRQFNHPWGRRHIKFVVLKKAGRIVSSCKLYELTIASRGELFSMNYIGAVFTPPALRGNGYGQAMLRQIIDFSKDAGAAGIYLFSDVGADYYEDLGFEAFGTDDFFVQLDAERETNVVTKADSLEPDIQILNNTHSANPFALGGFQPGVPNELIAEMTQHHERWLRQQPFGVKRGYHYLHFKLCKEFFLREHSALAWPDKVFFIKSRQENPTAYAITESAGSTLRVMEVIGSLEDRQAIWRALLQFARANRLRRIRGWESVVSDFAPNFSFDRLFPSGHNTFKEKILSYERNWGLPMFIPFNPKLEIWPNYFPCPFLELDHF